MKDGRMAPIHIYVMLDLYTKPAPLDAPAFVLQDLWDRGLIDSLQPSARLTARGTAYVVSLSYVPIPEERYVTTWPETLTHK